MNEPTPVTPLSYYEQSANSWEFMTRAMSLVAIAESSLTLLPFIIPIAFASWGMLFPTSRVNVWNIESKWQIIPALPEMIFAAVMLLSAVSIWRHRRGRKMFLAGAMGYAIFTVLTPLVTEIYFFIVQNSAGRPFSFAVTQIAYSLFFSMQLCLLPMLLWYFFSRPPVVEMFESPRSEQL